MAISEALSDLTAQLPYADKTQTELIEKKLDLLKEMESMGKQQDN